MPKKKQIRKIRVAPLEGATITREEAARAARVVRERRLSSPDPLRGADPSTAPILFHKRTGDDKEHRE